MNECDNNAEQALKQTYVTELREKHQYYKLGTKTSNP